MPIAYVLINTNQGKEKNCLSKNKKNQNITAINLVYRFYDLIAIVKTSNVQELNNSLKKTRNNKNVLSTETMTVIKY